MGERRFRASRLAGLTTIPAMVRDYVDTEVLEVQIIENLQRKDVEPTEEAEAIQFLLDRYEPGEIAQRLGRSENYVRQRIKLASLIEGFKAFVRTGEMTISLAVAVALFEPGEQQMMLESLEGEYQGHRIKRMIESRTFDLTKACFDVTDKTLVPKAGACVVCPFNAANQGNLFGEGKMVCTRTTCFENKKTKTFMQLLKKVNKEGLKLVPNISKYWVDEERNQWVMAQMEKVGLEVHLTNELDILKQPIEPTLESIKEEHRHYEYTEEQLTEFLDEALESFAEEKEAWDNALDNGFEKGILLDTDTYLTQTIFVKVREEADSGGSAAKSLEKRKMTECTPEEQITKINAREIRKKQIENNNQFKEVVDMIRETDYIDRKKALTMDEMVAISISLFENNIGFYSQREHFKDFFGDDSRLSHEELVARFKENFKKETFHRLLRFLLTRQVHLGESNHTNDLTNRFFYVAMQTFYKDKISGIEQTYAESRQKREARIKERVVVLEKQAKAITD
jgi:ParB family chromosome partitioning protein